MSIGSSSPENFPTLPPPSLTPPGKGGNTPAKGGSQPEQGKKMSTNASVQGAALQTIQKPRGDDKKATGSVKPEMGNVQEAAPVKADKLTKSGSGEPTQKLQGASPQENLESLKPDLPSVKAYDDTSSQVKSDPPPMTQQSLNDLGQKLGISLSPQPEPNKDEFSDMGKMESSPAHAGSVGKEPQVKEKTGVSQSDVKSEPVSVSKTDTKQPDVEPEPVSVSKTDAKQPEVTVSRPGTSESTSTSKDETINTDVKSSSSTQEAAPSMAPPQPAFSTGEAAAGGSVQPNSPVQGAGSTGSSSRASFFMSGFGGDWVAIAQANLKSQQANREQMEVVTKQMVQTSKSKIETGINIFNETLTAGKEAAKQIRSKGVAGLVAGATGLTATLLGGGLGWGMGGIKNFNTGTRIGETIGQTASGISNLHYSKQQAQYQVAETVANSFAQLNQQTSSILDQTSQTLSSAMSDLQQSNSALQQALNSQNSAMHQTVRGLMSASSS